MAVAIVKQALKSKGGYMPIAAASLLLFSCRFDSSGIGIIDATNVDRAVHADSAVAMDQKSDKIRFDFSSDLRIKDAQSTDGKPDLLKADALKADSAKVCPAASIGQFTGLMTIGVSLAVGGYDFIYKGKDAIGDALFDIFCGGGLIVAGKAFPFGQPTPYTVPSDKKKITITPIVAVANTVNLSIKVEDL